MDKKDFRASLILTATHLFAERGLNGVSIRELSTAAGVSISMISYYFEGKEGLYSSVLEEQFSCFEYMQTIKDRESEPLDKIEEYIRWSIQRNRDYPHLLRYYTSELTNPTRYFGIIVQPALEKALHILIDIIKEGITKKQFRDELNPEDTALAMAGMVNYYFLSSLATQKFINILPERDEELIRHYMDIFTRGILSQALPAPL
ncbi:MAG: TetR family transcriptional regulator [Geobacteraceae bacterium GWB2_52_12]|nr:MAG: TetR family transcriptional regulator [Geobacteraceae bacterium GWB2_52_12]